MPGHDTTLDSSCWIPYFYSATINGEIDDSKLSLRGECLGAPLLLQIRATNWPLADEINACNGDIIMAITEVIASNKMPTKDHLNLLIDLFGLSLSNTNKICNKREMWPLSFLSRADSLERKKGEDPKRRQREARSDNGCLLGFGRAVLPDSLVKWFWPRSLRWKNKAKHCSGWFVMREKHGSRWKNKLKKMDYKRSEQGLWG